MNAKMKQWTALAAVAVLVILAGGWFLLVSPKHSDAAALRTRLADKQRANALLMSEIAQLKAQQKDNPKQQAKLAAVAAKIPNNGALPTLIRSLNAAAADTGVELISMAPTPPVAVGAAATATSGTASASGTAGGVSSASVGALQQIGITLNVVGSYFQVAEYLDRLENLTRAFRVTTLNLAPGQNPVKPAGGQPSTESGKVLTASIVGQVFQTIGATSSVTTAK